MVSKIGTKILINVELSYETGVGVALELCCSAALTKREIYLAKFKLHLSIITERENILRC
jgi:hypothetical protein